MAEIKNIEYIKILLKYIDKLKVWSYQEDGSQFIQSIKKIEIANIQFDDNSDSPQFLVTLNLLFIKVNKYDDEDGNNIQFWRKQELEIFIDGIEVINETDYADDTLD